MTKEPEKKLDLNLTYIGVGVGMGIALGIAVGTAISVVLSIAKRKDAS